MERKTRFTPSYTDCLKSEERRNAIFEEAKSIRDTYNLTYLIKKAIVKHYSYHYHTKLGNVSKTIKFVDSILIYLGFNEEERSKFLNDNYRMYLSDYTDFRVRLGIFNKCGKFEESIFTKNRFLSKYAVEDSMTVNELYAICASKNFDISFDEIEHYHYCNSNKQELTSQYKLTREVISAMDAELLNKIKSYADSDNNKLTKQKGNTL